MPAPTRSRLVLDLDLDADPISGVLHSPHAPAAPFAGWIALVRELELAVQAARRSDHCPPAPETEACAPDIPGGVTRRAGKDQGALPDANHTIDTRELLL